MIKIYKIFAVIFLTSLVVHGILFKDVDLLLAFFLGELALLLSSSGTWAYSRLILGVGVPEGKASSVALSFLAIFKLILVFFLIYLALVIWQVSFHHFAAGLVFGLGGFLLAVIWGKSSALKSKIHSSDNKI